MALKIVLLGKTGHGKSSTGNTLLNMDIFRHEAGPTSTTQLSHSCTTTYGPDRSTLCVIDTPGNFETHYNNKPNNYQDYEKACNIMFTLMKDVSDAGIDAFFFIYNIMTIYGSEEENNICLLETIFGPDVTSKFGVLVFTHGDNFDKNFEEWYPRQTGRIAELIKKFDGKVVLISNTIHSDNERQAMINQALAIKNRQRRYNFDDYMEHESSRKRLLINQKLSEVKTKFEVKMDRLERQIKLKTYINNAEAKEFQNEIKKIEKKVQAKIEESYELNEQIDRLGYLTYMVNSKIKRCIIS